MSSSVPETIKAFNDKLDFAEAYEYDRDKIWEWLNGVVANPAEYGVNDPETTGLLGTVLEEIRRLCPPNGPDFIDPTGALDPSQHILRQSNRAWAVANPKVSKFIVRKLPHSNTFWWSPYDLLGLFLSLLGPAPVTADKMLYFFPLTAVYARWCLTLIRDVPKKGGVGGAGERPAMFQCTWYHRLGGQRDFVLGASLAGYIWGNPNGKNLVGTWEKELMRTRFDILSPIPGSIVKDVDFLKSPVEAIRPEGQTYGNCAETYPFNVMFTRYPDDEDRKTLRGLALKINFKSIKKFGSEIERHITSPCLNCKTLLEKASADTSGFNFDCK